MKPIQIVVGAPLVRRLDRAAKKRKVSRSALIRRSVEAFLAADAMSNLVEAERRAYAGRPASADEREAFRALSRAQDRVLRQLAREDPW